MKTKLKSLLIPTLLGGGWGIFTYLLGTLILSRFTLASLLFYPILFGGITVIISSALKSKLSFIRASVVGLISGLVYQILSPIFPFFSSVLAGASLGGGLAAEEGKLRDLFNRLVSILKGVFLFPIFIFTGGIIATLLNGASAPGFLLWFFWGGWISLGVCLISNPIFKGRDADENILTLSELSDFRTEAQEIVRELHLLESRYK